MFFTSLLDGSGMIHPEERWGAPLSCFTFPFTAMEEEIPRSEECLSLFSGIPCDTIKNLNY
jgi:hypothetical protein